MPMSATCRNAESRRSAAGFTLLELVVVLAIMGLVTGVAGVRVFSMINTWRERTQLESLEQQFARLPVLARQRGSDIVLPPPKPGATTTAAGSELVATTDPLPTEPPALDLPKGWVVYFNQPLRVRGSGLCEGARIRIEHGDRKYWRVVAPPFCQLSEDPSTTWP